MNYHVVSNIIDYSFFNEKNFFISESNSVSFSYNPIGSISTVVYSGKIPNKQERGEKVLVKKSNDDIYPDVYDNKNVVWKDATINDALNEIYKQAISIGANGIINLKIEYIPGAMINNVYRGPGIIVSGMAIEK